MFKRRVDLSKLGNIALEVSELYSDAMMVRQTVFGMQEGKYDRVAAKDLSSLLKEELDRFVKARDRAPKIVQRLEDITDQIGN